MPQGTSTCMLVFESLFDLENLILHILNGKENYFEFVICPSLAGKIFHKS